MDSSLEKLLEVSEEFQVDEILDEVKKWAVDDQDIREYGEELLEERRKRRQLAQATQTARHIYVQQHFLTDMMLQEDPSFDLDDFVT